MNEITLPEAARRFNIPYQTLFTAIKTGRVIGRQLGPRAWVVTEDAIRDALTNGGLRARPKKDTQP